MCHKYITNYARIEIWRYFEDKIINGYIFKKWWTKLFRKHSKYVLQNYYKTLIFMYQYQYIRVYAYYIYETLLYDIHFVQYINKAEDCMSYKYQVWELVREEKVTMGAFQDRRSKKRKFTRHQLWFRSYFEHFMYLAVIHLVANMSTLWSTGNPLEAHTFITKSLNELQNQYENDSKSREKILHHSKFIKLT